MSKPPYLSLASKPLRFSLVGLAVLVMAVMNVALAHKQPATTLTADKPTAPQARTTQAKAVVGESPAQPSNPNEPTVDTEAAPTTPTVSVPVKTVPTTPAPPTPPAPAAFGISSLSVSGANACLGEDGISYLHVSNATIWFKSNAGGQVKFWLQPSGLGLGSAGTVRSVTVPSGAFSGSLTQLSGMTGPPMLYAVAIVPEQGQGSVQLVVQAGSDTSYGPVITIPASASC